MKRFIGPLMVICTFFLSGCFDTVEETTFNDDGSGTYVSATDMSKMFEMIEQMGSAMGSDNAKMKDLEKLAVDTVIRMADMADSAGTLNAEERKLIEKGTARLILNFKEKKFFSSFNIPFAKPADIIAINNLLKSSKGGSFSEQLKKAFSKDSKPGSEDEMPTMGVSDGKPDISNYFDFTYEKSKLKRKVNKEMYAKVADDKDLQSLQQMSAMGMAVNFKTIINLPRPAKKAEGKGIQLSDDKKKITIEGSLEDFMEDASKFEYEIEY